MAKKTSVMHTFFYKQIHASMASAASGDVWLVYSTTKFKQKVEPTQKHGMEFFEALAHAQQHGTSALEPKVLENSVIVMPGHFLDGEIVDEICSDPDFPGFQKIYVQEDKTFYEKGRRERQFLFGNYADTPEFKALIKSYTDKGWKVRDWKKRSPLEDAYDKFQEDKELFNRANEELVLWNYGRPDFDPIQYRGGFSEAVYNEPEFQKYVAGVPFGWVGDSGARRREHDKLLEKLVVGKYELPVKQFISWVTSSDGRHFADSLAGYPLQEQLAKIRKNATRIYNLALIYSDPRHDGTWNGTEHVRELLKAEGKLLREIHNL